MTRLEYAIRRHEAEEAFLQAFLTVFFGMAATFALMLVMCL